MDAARKLGLEELTVRLTLRSDGETPYPWAAELRCRSTEEQRLRLSLLLEAQLGIPPERQSWSDDDAD